jgi:2-methylcitrate dehydratase PrpD
MESVTRELAEYAVQTTYEDLPEDIIKQTKRCFVDWTGVTLAATDSPTAKILSTLVKEWGGQEQASVIRSGYKTTVMNASLVNGSMAHVLDFDDFHPVAALHPSAFLVPVALSGAEWKGCNGREIIIAFVVGYEIAARVSLGAGKGAYQLGLGWHPTGTIGRIGTAVSFGKLLGFNPQQMATAIGMGATQAAGLMKAFGTMAKHFHSGKAAFDGVLSALLASRGFSAPTNILEGEDGFCQVISRKFDGDQMVDGLGNRYEILNNHFKPYPSCGQTHAVIGAGLDIARKISADSSKVKEVICEVSPIAFKAAGIKDPRDGNEAKFSLYYCAACALMGDVSMGKFTSEEIQKGNVQKLMKRIQIKTNPSFDIQTAQIEVTTLDGKKIESRSIELKGGPSNPMTEAELDAKFSELALAVLKDEKKVKSILQTLRTLETLKDVNTLMGLLRLP